MRLHRGLKVSLFCALIVYFTHLLQKYLLLKNNMVIKMSGSLELFDRPEEPQSQKVMVYFSTLYTETNNSFHNQQLNNIYFRADFNFIF